MTMATTLGIEQLMKKVRQGWGISHLSSQGLLKLPARNRKLISNEEKFANKAGQNFLRQTAVSDHLKYSLAIQSN